jgi:two-component system response regulator HydG
VNAVIYPRAGLAVLMGQEGLSTIHRGDLERVVPRSPAELRHLVGSSPDAEVMEGTTLDQVRERLARACREHETLDLALMALDTELSEGLRRRVARLLAELSPRDEVLAHLSRVLYAAPLPVSQEIPHVIALAVESAPGFEDFFLQLASSQPAIERVRAAWDRAAFSVLPSPSAVRAAELRAVREGAFRRMVDWVRSSDAGGVTVVPVEAEFADVPALLDAWIAELAVGPGPRESGPGVFVAAPDSPMERRSGLRVMVVPNAALNEYGALLERHGHTMVRWPGTPGFDTEPADVLIADVTSPMVWQMVTDFRLHSPRSRIVVLGGEKLKDAHRAVEMGADDYLPKPFPPEMLLAALENAGHQPAAVRDTLVEEEYPYGIAGVSESVHHLRLLVETAAQTDASVLISGESGTGKDRVARAIHAASRRAAGPFVAVHCSAVPAELLEQELFGFVKHAFTGALADRRGAIESASGGTFFLDEITEMSPPLQARLLGVIQEAEVRRLGASTGIPIDVRWIAASDRDLVEEVRAGRLREDLLYRLSTFSIHVPALRERRKDIPALARHFVREAAAQAGRPAPEVTLDGMGALVEHDWPGNVRELRNLMERAVILAHANILTLDHLQLAGGIFALTPVLTLAELEARHIQRALHISGGNRTLAAEMLGISRRTLQAKVASFGLEPDSQSQ